MFDVRVKRFQDSPTSTSLLSETLSKRSPIERVEYSQIYQISIDQAAIFFNDIVDFAEYMG